MVKDFKYIIKRILIGVGIALILMIIKDHGLILQAHAKSCDVEEVTYIYPWGTDYTPGLVNVQVNSNNVSNGATYLAQAILNFNGTYPVSLHDYDYMEVYVPTSLVMTYDANAALNGNIQTFNVVPLMGTTPNGWVVGNVDMSGISFKFSNDVSISSIRLRIPTFNLEFDRENIKVFFNNYWRVTYYSCSDDAALLEEQQKTNNLIEDSTIDNNKASSDIDTMKNKVASNGAITQLLTLPITLYQSILNATSGSCSPINLGSLYNHSLSLPCINLSNLLGSTLYNIIDILCSGLFILAFRKKMVDIFNHMTSLNDRGNELE